MPVWGLPYTSTTSSKSIMSITSIMSIASYYIHYIILYRLHHIISNIPIFVPSVGLKNHTPSVQTTIIGRSPSELPPKARTSSAGTPAMLNDIIQLENSIIYYVFNNQKNTSPSLECFVGLYLAYTPYIPRLRRRLREATWGYADFMQSSRR